LGCATERGRGDEDQKTEGVEAPPAEKIAEPAHGDDQADQDQVIN
jgi:hypothetical protein